MVKTMNFNYNMYKIRHMKAIKKSVVVHSAEDDTEVNNYFKWVICSLHIFISRNRNQLPESSENISCW